MACFTQRFPAAVLRLPRLGILNIHPSLLPAYRGPLPIFWQLRDGAPTGATVHYMDEGLDTGDIAAQSDVFLPDGLPGPEVERMLMLAGLDLLRKVLAELARGIVRRRPQSPGGSYYSFPTEEDFILSTDGPAWRAFRRSVAGSLPMISKACWRNIIKGAFWPPPVRQCSDARPTGS